MTAALGAVIMIAGGFFGVMTYAAPLIAAAFLIPVMLEFGSGAAMLAYAATAAVTALISPDKELAFFYVFIGYYPVLKRTIDRLRIRSLRFFLKLVFFAASVVLMYLFLIFILKLPAVLEEIGESGPVIRLALLAALVFIMIIWDIVLSLTGVFYEKKLRPKLPFMK